MSIIDRLGAYIDKHRCKTYQSDCRYIVRGDVVRSIGPLLKVAEAAQKVRHTALVSNIDTVLTTQELERFADLDAAIAELEAK